MTTPVKCSRRCLFDVDVVVVFVDHLKLEDALLLADSYRNSRYPYTKTKASLTELYGQPHKLALQHITEFLKQSLAYGVHFRTSSDLRLKCQTQKKRRQVSDQK